MTTELPLQSGTATAVHWERAAANHLKPPHQPYHPPRTASHHLIDAPTRRRVERIATRFPPPPPQTARKLVSTLPRSRKSLVVNCEIKAQPAARPRP